MRVRWRDLRGPAWACAPAVLGQALTVWCRSGMPILKTIMLKWASSRVDMERPWRPPTEARLPGAPLPWPRVPWRPLPGPSGELSDSEPPSGHSLALWCSSSSLEAGLWVMVGPRGDGGRQHHRSLWGAGPRVAISLRAPTLQKPQAHWAGQESRPGAPHCCRQAGRPQAGGWTHPQTLRPPVHTHPSLPRCQHMSPSLPLALLTAPAPPAPHFAAGSACWCPRNRRITAGATGPLCQATGNAAKISRGQTGGRPTGTLPSWPQPGPSPKASHPLPGWGEGGACS